MGIFTHEAAAVDSDRQQVYMTEDQFDGLFYRFTPTNYPDLTEGLLEAARVEEDGSVTWIEVPDPSASETLTRKQLPGEATAFLGGEGIWYHDDVVFWSTKFDNIIHAINTADQTYSRIYEADPAEVSEGTAILSGVDNLTVDGGSGDVYVAEDGGNMEIVIITPEGEVAPFLRIVDQDSSRDHWTGLQPPARPPVFLQPARPRPSTMRRTSSLNRRSRGTPPASPTR